MRKRIRKKSGFTFAGMAFRQGNLTRVQLQQWSQSLLELNTDAVLVFNHIGKLIANNIAAERMLGYTTGELMKADTYSQIVENSHGETFIHFYKLTLQGEPQCFNLKLVHQDGSIIESHNKTIPIQVDGQIIGVYVISKDVTERNKAEQELRITNEQLKSFIDNSSDGIIVVNTEGYIIHANSSWIQMMDYPDPHLVGKHIQVTYSYYNQSCLEEVTSRISKGEYNFHLKTDIVKHDGSLLYLCVSIYPIDNAEGQISGFATVLRDITKRKAAERALAEAEAKYRSLVEESLTGVYLLQEGYLMYANPKLCDMLGYSQEEFQQIKAIDFVVPDDRSILEENIKLRLRGERKNVIFSYRVCRKDGSIAELEGTGRVTEYNGKPAILGTLMDITERSHTDELLRKSDQLSIVGQLAAGVAHEIRNPLTSLKGFVQLIRSRSHEYTEFLDIMLSELDRINYIVSEFMLVAKPQAKQYQRNNIISIMDNVLSFLNSQAALFNVQFIKAAMSDALYVLCDENQIKQVFINLLKNAMEAMPKGGIVTIEMGYHSDRKVRIRIEDQGGGIPADKLAQLGEPFFTTKETGTGLGLMVCYKIIEAHKGCLNIQSVLGEGTLIDILLPEEQVLISS